jgi:predicted enzyme related to lactoylglutathione lyase
LEKEVKDNTDLLGISFVSVYTDDYQKAYNFYTEILGMKKQFDMGDLACYLNYGKDKKQGMYLQGGCEKIEYKTESARTAFVFSVESASALYNKLKEFGLKMIFDKPVDMGSGDFWFQCLDPCGNIIEFLGGK